MDINRTSKQSNAVLAGNAFVARFKREPVSPSDAAWLNGFVIALESNTSETSELQRALHVIDEAGKLSDWINRARPVVTDLMAAYERRIRTDCTPEQIAKEPWRCMEYIGAENLLRDQPIAVVELTAQKAGEQ